MDYLTEAHSHFKPIDPVLGDRRAFQTLIDMNFAPELAAAIMSCAPIFHRIVGSRHHGKPARIGGVR